VGGRNAVRAANGVEHQAKLSPSHEATFGGPIARDRLWFFTAGRLASTSLPTTLDQTGYGFTRKDENTRGEVKLTATTTYLSVFSNLISSRTGMPAKPATTSLVCASTLFGMSSHSR
jgi:hypothetical protein